MPNWVYNKVEAHPNTIKKLLNSAGRPTFTNIVPTPPELSLLEDINLQDTSLVKAFYKDLCCNDDSELRSIYVARHVPESFKDWRDTMLKSVNMEAIHLINFLQEEYGVTNWYDFNCKYYGCKWDASNDFGDYDITNIPKEIEFLTPWSPPENVISELAKTDSFDWHCDEESCAFSVNFHSDGSGSYSETDDDPIYFTPYIPTADDLEDYTMGLNNLKDVKETVYSNIDSDYFDVIEDSPDLFRIAVTDPYEDLSYEIAWDKDCKRVGDD